jgi:hypothetical protein
MEYPKRGASSRSSCSGTLKARARRFVSSGSVMSKYPSQSIKQSQGGADHHSGGDRPALDRRGHHRAFSKRSSTPDVLTFRRHRSGAVLRVGLAYDRLPFPRSVFGCSRHHRGGRSRSIGPQHSLGGFRNASPYGSAVRIASLAQCPAAFQSAPCRNGTLASDKLACERPYNIMLLRCHVLLHPLYGLEAAVNRRPASHILASLNLGRRRWTGRQRSVQRSGGAKIRIVA